MSSRKTSPVPTSEESHIEAHKAHIDMGSHVGPPVRKHSKCAQVVVVHVAQGEWLAFKCDEANQHKGAHYGLDKSLEWDLSWCGPDKLASTIGREDG